MKKNSKTWRVRRQSPQEAWQPNRRRKRVKDSDPKSKKQNHSGGDGEGPKKGKKILAVALRVLASLVLTVATLWAGFAAYRHATTSEYFSVSEFNIKGISRLSKNEVLTAAGIAKGVNVFRVDCSKASAMLEQHPWIRAAEIKRHLPRNVDIEVTERLAEAMVLFDVPYLVDDEGEVFKRWVLGDPTPSPVITGFTREQFALDMAGVQETIRDAISLAKRYRASGLNRVAPIAEVHCEVDGAFSLAIGGDPIYVRFGKGPYRAKLRRLAALLGQLKSEGRRPSVIFFDNEVRPDRATVRLKTEEPQSATIEAKKITTEKNSLGKLQKSRSKI